MKNGSSRSRTINRRSSLRYMECDCVTLFSFLLNIADTTFCAFCVRLLGHDDNLARKGTLMANRDFARSEKSLLQTASIFPVNWNNGKHP